MDSVHSDVNHHEESIDDRHTTENLIVDSDWDEEDLVAIDTFLAGTVYLILQNCNTWLDEYNLKIFKYKYNWVSCDRLRIGMHGSDFKTYLPTLRDVF